MKKITSLLSTLAFLVAFIPSIANAVVINTTTFNFSATCFDCFFTMGEIPEDEELFTEVKGELVLSNYVAGEIFGLENFVSFSYFGPSEHIDPFEVNIDNVIDVFGSVATGEFDVVDIAWFDSETETENAFLSFGGLWDIFLDVVEDGNDLPADFGNNATFTQVPEPSSVAIFALGLLGLAYRNQRRA